ncbi:MAG: metallophosphoesterase [Verrucomicrobiae bacterium]|nr:metallophosphoesterase [Verrucomicrobiae bacterium]
MPWVYKLAVVSDIHYASAAEQARGHGFEFAGLRNPVKRAALKLYRNLVWIRDPLSLNYLLDKFVAAAGSADYVICLGDLACDSAFLGLSDDAAFQSVRECLEKLRTRFGPNVFAVLGDHDLGKISLAGDRGGMRLASVERAGSLGINPFWQVELGKYVLIGVASSLLALPLFEPDLLEAEKVGWFELRRQHVAQVEEVFGGLSAGRKVLLFCHDPSALPFLWRIDAVRSKLDMVECTFVGHLHSELVLWKSRLLAGMPRINFLGHSVKRFSTALNEARLWREFNLRLCPALAGIELLKDGGFYMVELDPAAETPAKFSFHRIPR